MRKKLLVFVGTRPEIIKIAPFLRACKGRSFDCLLCTSGQHGALLSATLEECALRPDISFCIQGGLCEKSAACLTEFEKVLKAQSPDAVLVHGDTLSAFCGALAAFYQGIPVFHLEAGLRTSTPFFPFPEEFYRRAIDTFATLCFAPTSHAFQNLVREGKPENILFTVGNTVADGLLAEIQEDFVHPLLKQEKKTVLLTVHRRESLGAPLAEICYGVRDAVAHREDTVLLFPMHPNPAVQKTVLPILQGFSNIHLLSPLPRHTFRNLLARAAVALTDSGGVAEEATALGVPTLILREQTERPEGVEAGVLRLVGRDRRNISLVLCAHLDAPLPKTPSTVYGDGHASEKVAAIIEKYFSQGKLPGSK